jgi:hypothetical protein
VAFNNSLSFTPDAAKDPSAAAEEEFIVDLEELLLPKVLLLMY